jgi:SAM-dependent methyltransferase
MEFKEFDPIGEETLVTISKADKFNKWVYDVINPYCEGRILEIGSGIGNITNYFVKHNYDITASDLRASYLEILNLNFPTIKKVSIDIVKVDFEQNYSLYLKSFDTIYALNVVEHIEMDKLAIENMLSLLKKNGKLIILVPAFQALYNNFDEELMHYRRYNRRSLEKIMNNPNTSIIKSFYFNGVGILGWFFFGKILKRTSISNSSMQAYNFLVPIFRIIDYFFNSFFGLSVICIIKKEN